MHKIILSACLVLSALTLAKSQSNSVQTPVIYLIYLKNGGPFDKECGLSMNKPVKQEDADEILRRLNEFQKLWDTEGPVYLKTALNEIRLPFPYKEMQATLTACDFTAMSSPLIIPMKNFLSSAEKPRPLWAFPEILFHEIMHTYTRSVYEVSAMRQKYASEPAVVLNHLHVMALEKMVLLKMNKTEIYSWLDNRYRNGIPEYKRAWEIVNDIEGYEAFIKELKTQQPRK
ncbi:hypothetical protein QNI19_24680 [Cytophagaceae bacterium DM2B3-1]|uniref:DUF4157 domain-containing protein n=1 Tax=Xanthocytophaga flava TaxID=3048013 RepID=A0ABT7CQY2_9BACT|nr:hypothetical protein [Xanthocytophaga flavus]MDJ1496156.1 hypothetical protein [Xanthocytophaga flavus]